MGEQGLASRIKAGDRYGKLLVLERVSTDGRPQRRRKWLCRCDCGKEVVRNSLTLDDRHVRNCGCQQGTWSKKQSHRRTHNLSKTRVYDIWHAMKLRCQARSGPTYASYGARGIYVVDEWLNDVTTFYKWSLANGYEEHLQIDRMDVDGPYAPWNCRWVTASENARNKRKEMRFTKSELEVLISAVSQVIIDAPDDEGLPALLERLRATHAAQTAATAIALGTTSSL